MKKQSSNHRVTRRTFLGTTAAGSAALLTGGLTSFLRAPAMLADAPFIEATIPQLQALMASGQLTCKQLTKGYIDRIQSLNPLLHSVIELNPNANAIASQLDNERRKGFLRGPLHGIPLLVKDNVA
ncbi:MAG TPA: amidase family protein, partial [Thermoanaerobaculia bacterium]